MANERHECRAKYDQALKRSGQRNALFNAGAKKFAWKRTDGRASSMAQYGNDMEVQDGLSASS